MDSALRPDGTVDSAPSAEAGSDTISDGSPSDTPSETSLSDATLPDAEAGSPCGSRTGMRGLTHRSMTVAGLARTYLVYLPPSLSPTTPAPLVFVHHGYTMSGGAMYTVTQYSALADSQGLAVAFPDGESGPNSLGPPWNVGPNACYPGNIEDATGDDFDFVSSMQADIALDQCIDTPHVFLTGFSMGGYFAHHVGCMRPDLARAVAPHSGGTHDFSTCAPGHKPVIIFHGDSDGVVPESCDTQAAAQWVTKNGCGAGVNTVTVQGGYCNYYQNCPADGQVAICIFAGMGHCWAGGAADGGIYSCTAYASATQLEWNFFKMYAW